MREVRATGKWYESTEAVCCWYKGEGSHKIVCEGFVENGSLIQTFPTDAAKVAHTEGFCRNHQRYRNCPIARMVSEERTRREEQE